MIYQQHCWLPLPSICIDVAKSVRINLYSIFQILMVEFNHIKEGNKVLTEFMATKGYFSLAPLPTDRWYNLDNIFMKKDSGFKEVRARRVFR